MGKIATILLTYSNFILSTTHPLFMLEVSKILINYVY